MSGATDVAHGSAQPRDGDEPQIPESIASAVHDALQFLTRPILPWAIAGVAVVVAPVSAYAATEAEGWHTWVWLVIGSIAALVAWGVPLMRQNVLNDQHKQALAAANNRARLAEEQALKAEEREVEALTEARIVVSYAIWPVVTALAEHVACNAKPDRDKALPKVVKPGSTDEMNF